MEMTEMLVTNSKKATNSTKVYGCSKCSYKTNRAYNVQRHFVKHFEKPPKELQHMCPFSGCSFTTLRYDHLKRHILGVHRIEDTIPLVRSQKEELSTNQAARVKESKIKKTKSQPPDNNKLKKTYKAAKTYKCPECNYRTNRAYNVQRHLAQHGEYPEKEILLHVCIINGCGFSTTRWDHLSRHITRVHPDSGSQSAKVQKVNEL